MGINLSEGFRALSSGLQQFAGVHLRREEQSVEQLRAENMARLQHSLALDRDAQNHKQSIDLANMTADRQEKHDDRMLDRQRLLIEGQDNRQAQREAAADDRYAKREAVLSERFARQQSDNDDRAAASERNSAAQEMGSIKARIETLRKSLTASDPLTGGVEGRPVSAMELMKSSPEMQSLFFDLKRADQRYRAADQALTGAGRPQNFSRENSGSTRSALIDDADY